MISKIRVCAEHEVIEGEIKSFSVDGVTVPILVTRVGGEIFAGTSMCPHEDVSLARGCIRDGTLVCRAHGYAFDLRSGQCTHDPRLRWKRYRVSVLSGDVFVALL